MQALKTFLHSYFSAWLIMLIDLAVSAIATVGAWLLLSTFRQPVFASFQFACVWLVQGLVSSAISFYLLRTYLCIVRHTTLKEVGRLMAAVAGKEVCLILFVVFLPWMSELRAVHANYMILLLVTDALLTVVGLIAARLIMVYVYESLTRSVLMRQNRRKVLVYGTGDKSVSLVKRLAQSPHYAVCGFLEYSDDSIMLHIAGYKEYSFADEADLKALKEQLQIEGVIFAREIDAKSEQNRLIEYCNATGLKALFAPTIDEVVDGKVMSNSVRAIKIEDLLGRDEIQISLKEIVNEFQGKTILVTGAAGSIGSELCRQLATFGISRLLMFDNAETPMHNVRLEFEERFPDVKFVPIIGDVRQEERLDYVFRKWHPQVVFHAAAYKHVPLMEENPCEAVLVNVIGSRNVANKCLEYDVEKMVMVSTDKAVNPTNIMGCTKRLAEIYVQSLGLALEKGELQGKTRFVTTRFGNVLGSNGSVIPRFREQIAKGGPVTVTHPEITRFFMTIPEACRLVMEAAVMTKGNQIFVFDMGASVKIVDLARRMIDLAGFTPDVDIKIEFTGLRPGEKLYEEVLSNEENTTPTKHPRIRIARVREYSHEDAVSAVTSLEDLSRKVLIPDMVVLMKNIVPEFISKNSVYEKYDKK